MRHDQHRHDGEGRGKRDISGRSLQRVDGLPDDQPRIADDLRNDVVAERQRKGEDRAGDDAGQRQRQDHRAERLARIGAEIGGRLDEVRRNAFERRLRRQDHVGQPDIDEDQERADVAERQRRAADDRQGEHAVEQPAQDAARPRTR